VIVGFVNEKGGVGKTTLAIHTATWLAQRGHRVVLFDLDTQGGVSHFLGLTPDDAAAQLLQSIMFLQPDHRPPISSYMTPFPISGYPGLVLIRGYTASGDIEAELHQPGHPRPGEILAEALAPLNQRDAIVVVDTGPYAGKLQEAVLDAADYVLVPGVPEGATEAGILKIAQHLQQLDRAITGLIPTRILVTSRKHRETVLDWKRANGLGPLVYFDPPRGLVGLPQRVVWAQLYRTAKTIWDVTPSEVAASRADLTTAKREMTMIQKRLAFDIGLGVQNE
jgi:cellulose biosynthesis protein BcsQ